MLLGIVTIVIGSGIAIVVNDFTPWGGADFDADEVDQPVH